MRLFFSTLLLAVLLSACNDTSDTTTESVTQTPPDRATAPAEDVKATLNTTLDALRGKDGNLAALAPDVAVSTIDKFSDQLADVEGADAITTNLERLRAELTSDKVNAPLTGMLLVTLSGESKRLIGVGNAATNALVNSLTSTGNRLMEGATSVDSHLGQTLKAIKANALNITALSRDAAIDNIDTWITTLETMPGTTEMTTEMRALRIELTRDNINAEVTADHLKTLAAQTEELANGNVSLEALAFALKAGAWRLEGK